MHEVAEFICVGVGSFINLFWQYDDTRISEDAVVIVTDESDNGKKITSTLMINGSMTMLQLQRQSTVREYTLDIQCILQQRVPLELNLQGRDDLIFSARLVITLGKCDTNYHACIIQKGHT